MPTQEEFDLQVRRRAVGRTIAEICGDLVVVPGLCTPASAGPAVMIRAPAQPPPPTEPATGPDPVVRAGPKSPGLIRGSVPASRQAIQNHEAEAWL
jgi:hypothetical protein